MTSPTLSQSTEYDPTKYDMIEKSEIKKIQKNLEDFTKLKAHCKLLEAKYRACIMKADTSQALANKLYLDSRTATHEREIASLKKQNESLKNVIQTNVKTIDQLRNSYQSCKGEVFRLKGKRAKSKGKIIYIPPYN
ncbi:MAG: hypothetical protein WKF87_06765 [Chryseolinea sp.]